MRITFTAEEVFVPSGQYGDEDDMLCRGCGREICLGDPHTVLRCLQNIRKDNEEAVASLQKKIDNLKMGDRLV